MTVILPNAVWLSVFTHYGDCCHVECHVLFHITPFFPLDIIFNNLAIWETTHPPEEALYRYMNDVKSCWRTGRQIRLPFETVVGKTANINS